MKKNIPERVVSVLAEDFPSRNGLFPDLLEAVAQFIESEFKSLGYTPQSQTNEPVGGRIRNVFVVKAGTNPSLPHLVIGAHYDAVVGTPGADDNASGVAGLLRIAQILANKKTSRTIHLVAFANEEPPFFFSGAMGSRWYAAELRRRGIDVHLMITLEMIGYADASFPQSYPFPLLRMLGGYPKNGNFIGIVGNLKSARATRKVKKTMREACSFGVESLIAPGFLPPLYLSDHSSFWKYGFPAVMVTDTAFLRNPHYHLPTDTPDTLNFQFLEDVVQGVVATVVAMDS